MTRQRMIPLAIVPLVLAGCAAVDHGDYPSLARRPVERQLSVVPGVPATAPIPEPVSTTLAEAIAALGRDADSGNAAFRTALDEARPLVEAARGAAVGSEAWAVGQRGFSRLEAARGPTTLALSELDRLALERLDAGDSSGADALAVQQARVTALVAAQDAVLASLSAGLEQ